MITRRCYITIAARYHPYPKRQLLVARPQQQSCADVNQERPPTEKHEAHNQRRPIEKRCTAWHSKSTDLKSRINPCRRKWFAWISKIRKYTKRSEANGIEVLYWKTFVTLQRKRSLVQPNGTGPAVIACVLLLLPQLLLLHNSLASHKLVDPLNFYKRFHQNVSTNKIMQRRDPSFPSLLFPPKDGILAGGGGVEKPCPRKAKTFIRLLWASSPVARAVQNARRLKITPVAAPTSRERGVWLCRFPANRSYQRRQHLLPSSCACPMCWTLRRASRTQFPPAPK